MNNVHDLKASASGRWLEILADLAPALQPAIDRLGRHVPCPVHGGKDGFRLFRDASLRGGGVCNTCGTHEDGISLLQWVNGWSFKETVEAVEQYLGCMVRRPQPPNRCTPMMPDTEKNRQRLLSVWKKTEAPEGSMPLELYLQRRGLRVALLEGIRTVRFHPALPYYENGVELGQFPAMVAMVLDGQGVPASIHRTYLTSDGQKAPVSSPRKLLPPARPISGGCIPLAPLQPVLGIAEGIETALAVRRATGMSVWSAVNATLMAHWNPPPGVQSVIIWADRDKMGAGEEAARKLKARMWKQGIQCRIMLPPADVPAGRKGIDWNDILLQSGLYGFPRKLSA